MTINPTFMLKAIQKAYEGVAKEQSPFGACIVKDDEIISCEHNVLWANTDTTAHAEIIAIRKACQVLGSVDLSGCWIYSTCEPCPMCFGACHWARIETIVFGTTIADATSIGFNELEISAQQMKELGKSPIILIDNVMRSENLALFERWYGLTNKRAY